MTKKFTCCLFRNKPLVDVAWMAYMYLLATCFKCSVVVGCSLLTPLQAGLAYLVLSGANTGRPKTWNHVFKQLSHLLNRIAVLLWGKCWCTYHTRKNVGRVRESDRDATRTTHFSLTDCVLFHRKFGVTPWNWLCSPSFQISMTLMGNPGLPPERACVIRVILTMNVKGKRLPKRKNSSDFSIAWSIYFRRIFLLPPLNFVTSIKFQEVHNTKNLLED